MIKTILLASSVPSLSFAVLMWQAAAEGQLPALSVLIIPIIVIIALVALNGLYVAAEFAIIGVRTTQIEQMAIEGDKKAAQVLEILESRPRQDEYIATAQLGITIASLGLAMYGELQISHFIEPYLVHWFGLSETAVTSIGYVIALSLLTYMHVVLGEMVPKTLALLDSSTMVLRLARPMQISQAILKYPVKVLNAIGNLLLKLLRIPPAHGHAHLMAPDEIELIVAESAEGGLLDDDEQEMIRNIFDFSERNVGQVMTPRTKVQAIPLEISRQEIYKIVTESRHSRFPVYEGDLDHITGILHLKDLVRQAIKPTSTFDLRLILRAAPAVPEDQSVEILLAAFKRQQLHMAVVLDEFGGMAGIVTLEDLVEEVVGEVRDEFDLEKEPYVEIEPGVIEVAGDYLVADLQEDVFLGETDDLPDVETVGGLVISVLGRPPELNDEAVFSQQVSFQVLDVDRRAVTRVRVEFPALDDETSDDGDETAVDDEKAD